MTTRPRRKRKEEIMKAEVESIVSKLNMTDDSSHGIKIAAIENKGRGIKVRTRVSILPFCFHHHFFPPLAVYETCPNPEFVVSGYKFVVSGYKFVVSGSEFVVS